MKYDIEFMSEIQKHMNLIPIIAKADHLTTYEFKNYKNRVLNK